ncbi:hypothetical protein B0T17DRAFT_508065 [Bombardia bombarda]|uniref:Uncharacterized protein n=1 Tax=Bombardia bombarda TaxID=252184 RepID=A0AA39X0R8_9PEZI|nr:hypothetical protein B0T17DRAFT_508065 [Bombardia bombarda]
MDRVAATLGANDDQLAKGPVSKVGRIARVSSGYVVIRDKFSVDMKSAAVDDGRAMLHRGSPGVSTLNEERSVQNTLISAGLKTTEKSQNPGGRGSAKSPCKAGKSAQDETDWRATGVRLACAHCILETARATIRKAVRPPAGAQVPPLCTYRIQPAASQSLSPGRESNHDKAWSSPGAQQLEQE